MRVRGPRSSSLATAIGGVRIVVGVVLALVPRLLLRGDAADAPGSMTLMTRTVGIRDIVLGIGTVASARDDAVGRWIRLGLLSDGLDTVAASFSAGQVGTRGALTSALVPVPVIVADLLALAMLRAETDVSAAGA